MTAALYGLGSFWKSRLGGVISPLLGILFQILMVKACCSYACISWLCVIN